MNRLILMSLAAGLAQSAIAQTFRADELKPLPGQDRSYGFGINDAGTVVGQIGTFNQFFVAARWVGDTAEPLGVLSNYYHSLAHDINSAGQIVGWCINSPPDSIPFIWENGVMAPLPLPPGFEHGGAVNIEDDGLVTGWVYTVNKTDRPCAWRYTGGAWTATLLPIGSADAGAAYGANSAGTIVGFVVNPGSEFRAARWDPGTLSYPEVGPAGTPTGGWAINDSEQIVGSYVLNNIGNTVLLASGTATNLGHLSGYAHLFGFSISGSGVIVGHGHNGSPFEGRGAFTDSRAFVWSGSLRAINPILTSPAGADIRQARDINASGQIAAIGAMHGLPNYRAFRVTPCYPNCDNSLTAPILNVSDFTCFLNKYSAGDTYANCDGSTIPPALNVSDFTCFINAYTAGCP